MRRAEAKEDGCKGVGWRVALVLSGLVLLALKEWGAATSLVAVWVTLSQLEETREQNRLLIRPHLIIMTFTERCKHDPTLIQVEVELQNNGLGPAIIDRFLLLCGDTETLVTTPNEFRQALAQHFPQDYVSDDFLYACRRGMSLKAGHTLKVGIVYFHLERPAEADQPRSPSHDLRERLGDIGILIEYSDMRGEAQTPYNTREHGYGLPT